jgi:hypothetical protein
MTVTATPKRASAGEVASSATVRGTRVVNSQAAFSSVAISRSLTSGATLAATYSTLDDSLTLKASVAF